MKNCCVSLLVFLVTLGCDSRYRDDLDYSYDVVQSWTIDEIQSGDLVQFETVDFDLVSSATIRRAISEDQLAASREVLHIGSGTGLIPSLCLLHEAKRVVATDIRPAAVSNTRYNVASLAPEGKLETRLRPASQQSAFSAIEPDEKFDLIITNFDQNHGDGEGNSHAAKDAFKKSFLKELPSHLRTGGRAIVICSHPETFRNLLSECKKAGLKTKALEEDFEGRQWESADVPLSPAILFEVRPVGGKS